MNPTVLVTMMICAPALAVAQRGGVPPVSDYRSGASAPLHLTAGASCPVVFGTPDGGVPEGFTELEGATRLTNGNVVVLDVKPRGLAFFDSRGKLLARGGRPGRGPGELASTIPMLMPYRGDSVAVYDQAVRLIHVYSGAGKFGRSFAVPIELGQRGPAGSDLIALIGAQETDGAFVGTLKPFVRIPPGNVIEDSVRLVWIDATGTTRTTSPRMVNAYATMATVFTPLAGNRMSVRTMAPGRVSRAPTFPSSRQGTVATRGGYVFHFEEPNDALTLIASDGTIARRILLPPVDRQRRPTTGQTVNQSEAQMLQIFADHSGRAWVEVARANWADNRLWWIFDAQGRLVADATTPPDVADRAVGSKIMEIGADYLLMRRSDADGVQTVSYCPFAPRR